MLPPDFVWRLLLAAGLGAAVGLEREYRRKPAGLRTNILIAIGSALFTILSMAPPITAASRDRSSPASASSAAARFSATATRCTA